MPDPVKVASVTPPAPATPAPAAAKPAVPPAEVKPAVTPAPATPGVQTVPLPELMEERNKRQALEKSVQDMQVELAAMKRVVPTPAAPAQQNDYQKQLDHLWETEPRRAVQAEIMTAITWYDTVQAQVDTQEHNLATKYPDYNTYRNEIRGYVRSLPVEQRMREGVVELAYYAVKGQKVDVTMDSLKKQWEDDFLRKLQSGEVGSIPPGMASSPPVFSQVQATDEEKRVADAMGMSVEDYLKHRIGGAK